MRSRCLMAVAVVSLLVWMVNPVHGEEAPGADPEENSAQEEVTVVEEETTSVDSVDDEGGTEAGEVSEEMVDGEGETHPTQVWASPKEAMVAVRGTATANLGVLSLHRGQPVIWTTLSALDNNAALVVTTPEGEEIPIRAIFGSGNRDLAFLIIEDGVEGLPFAEPPKKENTISRGSNVRIIGPQDQVSQSVDGSGSSRRFPLPSTDDPILNGSPVVDSSGNWVGIYSAARKQPVIAGSRTTRNADIWPPGIVQAEGDVDWQPINLRDFFEERQLMNEILYEIGQLQAFFSRSAGNLEYQPLIAARERLARRIRGNAVETERNQARRSFVFTVRSVASGIERKLDRGIEDFYNYFIPELLYYQELYNDLDRQVRRLEQNPSQADSMAR